MTDRIVRLQVQAQNYPWGKVGSDSIISEFGPEAGGPGWSFGEETPYAELWISSTHPNAPAKIYPLPSSTSLIQQTLQTISPAYFGKTLSSYLGENPGLLGKAGEKFGAPVEAGKGERFLPFLMKVLTCKQALPLQIHPDKELSEKLHKENPKQFADFNHKPEIAVALAPFLGFAGFQPINTIKSVLTSIPELDALLRPFESYQTFVSKPDAGPKELKELVRSVLRMDPKSDSSGFLKTVKDALAAGTGMNAPGQEARDGNDVDAAIEGLLSRFEREGVEAFGKAEVGDEEKKRLVKALKKMQEFYKGDPGSVVAAFMMNLIELQPGEGIYVGADGVHAWLDGQIIELMATSDNVLNLGFVPAAEKDSVDLFIDAVTCEPKSGEEYKLSKQEWKLSSGAGATIYKVPTEEFSLYHVDGDAQKSTTIKPLNGLTVCIVTAVNTTAGKITQTRTVEDGSARAEVDDIKRGQVYLIGAGTEVEFAPGVEVWASFWDDQEQEQSGTAGTSSVLSTAPSKTFESPYLAALSANTRHEEYQYLDLIRHVIQNGQHRPDRTGTGTVAMFAPPSFRFSLANNTLPLLTTKRVFTRGVIEELLWFVAGHTDGKILSDKGVNIWEGNGSREYLDRIGLTHRRVGDLGPVYGFQWRHFGATYKTCEDDYTGQGVDQLAQVIDKIKNNPTDRRIIMSAWNPADLSQMALPPCHMFCQFFVTLPGTPGTKPKLSCLMYQRSCDLGLGVPFNIASYSLLTHMIALVTDTEPHEFILQMGDAHVYKDHVEPLKTQLEREPREFPKLNIKRSKEEIGGIDGFRTEDFEVVGYKPMGKIEMKMSA